MMMHLRTCTPLFKMIDPPPWVVAALKTVQRGRKSGAGRRGCETVWVPHSWSAAGLGWVARPVVGLWSAARNMYEHPQRLRCVNCLTSCKRLCCNAWRMGDALGTPWVEGRRRGEDGGDVPLGRTKVPWKWGMGLRTRNLAPS